MKNREIKFRVWDKLEKRFDKNYHLIMNMKGAVENLQNGAGGEDYVLQQFTSLTDIHGKEIYEGDIITYVEKTHEHGDATHQQGKIIYDEEVASFAIAGEKTGEVWNYFTDYGLSKFEVVGNVFQGEKS